MHLHKHYYFIHDYDLLILRNSFLHEFSHLSISGRHSKHSDTNMLKTFVLQALYRRHTEVVITVKNYGLQNPISFLTGKAKASGVKGIFVDCLIATKHLTTLKTITNIHKISAKCNGQARMRGGGLEGFNKGSKVQRQAGEAQGH